MASGRRAAAACCWLGLVVAATTGSPSSPPVEIGSVRWLTSLTAARAEAKRSSRPIFLQFTEIPG